MTKLVCKGKSLKMEAFSFIPVSLRVDLMENSLFLKIDFDGGRGQLEVDLSDIRKVLENLTKHAEKSKDFLHQKGNGQKNQSAKCGCDCHTYHIDKKHCKCKKGCSEAD